jgi:hypothetical protein
MLISNIQLLQAHQRFAQKQTALDSPAVWINRNCLIFIGYLNFFAFGIFPADKYTDLLTSSAVAPVILA